MKFALDLIVYFEDSIIKSILIREYVILIRPISNPIALSMTNVDILGRNTKFDTILQFFCACFYEILFLLRRLILHFLQI